MTPKSEHSPLISIDDKMDLTEQLQRLEEEKVKKKEEFIKNSKVKQPLLEFQKDIEDIGTTEGNIIENGN